jgi:hypothetical protein
LIRKGLTALFALATANCGWPSQGAGDVCAGAAESLIVEALGVSSIEPSMPPATAPAIAQCVWRANADAAERFVSATILRQTAADAANASAEHLFEEELRALEAEFSELRVVGALGDAAVMGFSDLSDRGFSGGLIARKDETVLVMRIDGDDPAAFEALARDLISRY